MFLHSAEAPGNGQQLFLLLLLPGQVGEEDHLAADTFGFTKRSVHRPVDRSVHRSVCGALVFLWVAHSVGKRSEVRVQQV